MRNTHLAVGALAAVLLAGCGGSTDGDTAPAATSSPAGNGMADKTGPEVAQAAADALEKSGAVHVTGTGTTEGQELALDLQLVGEDISGSVTLSGTTIEIISVGGSEYIKADAAYWTSTGIPADALAQVADKWVVVPDTGTSSFDEFSLANIADQLRNPDGTIEDAVTEDEVDGDPVVLVTQDDGSTLTVAGEGDPYPLSEDDEGDEPGSITFSDFGKKATIEAPPNPVDASTIGG